MPLRREPVLRAIAACQDRVEVVGDGGVVLQRLASRLEHQTVGGGCRMLVGLATQQDAWLRCGQRQVSDTSEGAGVPPALRPTTGPAAADAHRRGAEALASGRPHEAASSFRQAVTEDPCFALAHAGLAVALSELGDDERLQVTEALDQARRCSRRLSRGERHHVEVVVLALRGDLASASALAREHLVDFPDDAVIARLLAGWER